MIFSFGFFQKHFKNISIPFCILLYYCCFFSRSNTDINFKGCLSFFFFPSWLLSNTNLVLIDEYLNSQHQSQKVFYLPLLLLFLQLFKYAHRMPHLYKTNNAFIELMSTTIYILIVTRAVFWFRESFYHIFKIHSLYSRELFCYCSKCYQFSLFFLQMIIWSFFPFFSLPF